jgi:Rieske Fe-S protein
MADAAIRMKDFMALNRREFVVLSCACAAGCAMDGGANLPIQLKQVNLDAGAARDYATDGVYDRFAAQGFFVVRRGERLFAISAICTHRRCKLKTEPDRSFYCKCHGSTFNPDGKVTEGPATLDLPTLPTTVDENGRLIIKAISV